MAGAGMVHIDLSDLRRLHSALERLGKDAPRAMSRALNHTVRKARTRASSEIREEYDIKAGDIRATMKSHYASVAHLLAELLSKGRRIPLYRFSPRPSTPGSRPPVGISARIRKSVGFEVFPGVFIARGATGGVTAFKRTGVARLPIQKQYGPSVPQMLEDVSDEIEGWAAQEAAERLRHEVEFMIGRAL